MKQQYLLVLVRLHNRIITQLRPKQSKITSLHMISFRCTLTILPATFVINLG